MKKLLIAPLLCLTLVSSAALAEETPELLPAWTVSEGVSAPESAYVDPGAGLLFVSQIGEGGAIEKDGDGWLSKLSTDGKVIKDKWVVGLNSPKGLRSHGGTLWVADIDTVISISIASGKVLEKVSVPGATFLNDVAVGTDGSVYVSDMLQSRVIVIKDGKPSVFLAGPEYDHPNGLLVEKDKLIIAGWGKDIADDFTTGTLGRVLSVDLKTKKVTPITSKPLGNLDGIESDGKGGYLVTDWMSGKVHHISESGVPTTLGTFPQGAADLAYLPKSRLLILPQMVENKISAFKLSE